MTRKFYGILILVAAATFGSSAMAAETSANSNFYVGGHGAFTDTGWGSGWSSTGFGFDLLGGLSPRFSRSRRMGNVALFGF